MQWPIKSFTLCLGLIVSSCSGQPPVDPLPFEEANEEDAGYVDDAEQAVVVEVYDFESAGPWFECPSEGFAEGVVEVEALSRVHQYFGEENRRTIEEPLDFPEGSWAQVGMYFELECPDGAVCDHWDRTGSVELVLNPGAPAEEEVRVELLRHITPYRMGMCHYVDLTPLAGLLRGRRAIRSFIDTWVGPGHEQGAGWLVSARFVFTPGQANSPAEVINVWNRRNITVGQVETDQNIASQIDRFDFSLPEEFSRVEAHLTTTGHSFGNTYNCAEFCSMRHDVIVNGTTFSLNPWRDDCSDNPVSPQAGTWQYGRNGWCPGAVAIGDRLDITGAVEPGENVLDFDILLANGQEYHNVSPVDLLPYTVVAMKLYVYE